MLRIFDTWLKALQNNHPDKKLNRDNSIISRMAVNFIDQTGDNNSESEETNIKNAHYLNEKKSYKSPDRLVDLELLK